MPLLGHPLLLPPPRNADQYILLLPTSSPPTWTPMIAGAVSLSMDFPTQSTRPGPGWVGSGRSPPGRRWCPALPGSSVASPEEARNVLWGSLTPEGRGKGEPPARPGGFSAGPWTLVVMHLGELQPSNRYSGLLLSSAGCLRDLGCALGIPKPKIWERMLPGGWEWWRDTTDGFPMTTTMMASANSVRARALLHTSIISFNPMRLYDYFHLTDGETEEQNSSLTCQGHSQGTAEADLGCGTT